MQMPPFMRASSADPLTLTYWQYNLLMEWADNVAASPESLHRLRHAAEGRDLSQLEGAARCGSCSS